MMAPEAVQEDVQQLVIVHGTTQGSSSSQIVPLLVPFLVTALIFLIISRYSKSSIRRSSRQLPASPPSKLPIIGHLHLVGSLPHVSLRDLAAEHGRDGLLLLHLGGVPTLVVSSPSAAEAVLRTHDHVMASRPWSPVADIIFYGPTDVAFAPYGEQWRQARKLVTTHVLSASKVHSFRHGRLEEVRFVVSKIRQSSSVVVDMSDLLGAYTNDVVCRAVLGESHRKQGWNCLLRELIEINVSLLGGFNLEDYFPKLARLEMLRNIICAKAKRVSRRWDQLLHDVIDNHITSNTTNAADDFVHVLLGVQEEYGLTMDNIRAILVDMFEAGIETSYLVLQHAMAELMSNRRAMTKLQEEVRRSPADDIITEDHLSNMTYLKAVVKETMRLHPPVPLLLPHLSIANCEINGYWIPCGTRVIVNTWALGRDPNLWERPEEFMPERFLQGGHAADVDIKGKDFQFLPFGSGRRICPGINFGMATVEIMLANLMYHFDWELPTGSGGVDMKELFGLTLRRKEKLFLVPKIP